MNGEAGSTREEVMALLERRQRAWEGLDADTLARDYAEDAVIESPTTGVHRGPAAVARGLRVFFDAFDDLTVRTESLIVDGSQVAHAVRCEGTNTGGLFGLPPSGKPFTVTAVFLYELRGLEIVRERRIYDFTGMLVQIGVLKAKPA